MSFNSFLGLFFAAGVIAIAWSLPRGWRNGFLLVASLIFYAYGDPLYTVLLLGVVAIGFVAGLLIETYERRKTVLAIAVILLLAILGVFKYFNFFAASFGELLSRFGLHADTVTLQILLPIGVSFYTFQTIGYLVDVFRRDVKAERNLVDFALFVSFFPQLVAGPIERSRNLLQQVKTVRRAPDANDISYGCLLIAQGYAKKVVIADTLGPYVDLIFAQDNLSAPLIIVGLLFFAFQIYGDFSGYTDIARGYSRLLGFRIILNFDRPYFATSPSNFWRRWHISLSSWFTQYLYIPLGGNRSKSTLRRWSNVLVTMGLSGLWHGASFNFIIWGLYHGVLIIAQRGLEAVPGLTRLNAKLRTMPARLSTFVLMLLGWLYFRVEDPDRLIAYHIDLATEWRGWFEASLLLSQGLICLAAALAIDLFEKYWLDVHASEIRRSRGLSVYLAALLVFIVLFASGASESFIYFRF